MSDTAWKEVNMTQRAFAELCQRIKVLPPGNYWAGLFTSPRKPLEFGKPPEQTQALIIRYGAWDDTMRDIEIMGEMPWQEWDLAMEMALGDGRVLERCQDVYEACQRREWDAAAQTWREGVVA